MPASRLARTLHQRQQPHQQEALDADADQLGHQVVVERSRRFERDQVNPQAAAGQRQQQHQRDQEEPAHADASVSLSSANARITRAILSASSPLKSNGRLARYTTWSSRIGTGTTLLGFSVASSVTCSAARCSGVTGSPRLNARAFSRRARLKLSGCASQPRYSSSAAETRWPYISSVSDRMLEPSSLWNRETRSSTSMRRISSRSSSVSSPASCSSALRRERAVAGLIKPSMPACLSKFSRASAVYDSFEVIKKPTCVFVLGFPALGRYCHRMIGQYGQNIKPIGI